MSLLFKAGLMITVSVLKEVNIHVMWFLINI